MEYTHNPLESLFELCTLCNASICVCVCVCVVFFYGIVYPKIKMVIIDLSSCHFLTCMVEFLALNTKDDTRQNALLQHTVKLNVDHGFKEQ